MRPQRERDAESDGAIELRGKSHHEPEDGSADEERRDDDEKQYLLEASHLRGDVGRQLKGRLIEAGKGEEAIHSSCLGGSLLVRDGAEGMEAAAGQS